MYIYIYRRIIEQAYQNWGLGGLKCSQVPKHMKLCELIKTNAYFPVDYTNQNIFTWGGLGPESSVISRGQTLKACNTKNAAWNWYLTSYSYSTVRDLSVELFKFIFGQIHEVGNFGLLCVPRLSVKAWVCDAHRVYHFTEYVTVKNILLYRLLQSESIHAASNLSCKRASCE